MSRKNMTPGRPDPIHPDKADKDRADTDPANAQSAHRPDRNRDDRQAPHRSDRRPHPDHPGSEQGAVCAAGDAAAVRPSLALEMLDLGKTVGLAVLVALIFRFAFFQGFNIPSGSMIPTLLVGDFIVVSKGSYGYSKASLIYPLTNLDTEARILANDPVAGDVAVFKNAADHNKDYIKRVIGVAGDKVQTRGGVLYLNDQPVARVRLEDRVPDCGFVGSGAATYRETLPNGVSYVIQQCTRGHPFDNAGPFIVPEGHFFLMGDNRDNSRDSRSPGVGFIPRHALVGKATRLGFSVDGEKARLWELWKWPSAIRYSRTLDPIE